MASCQNISRDTEFIKYCDQIKLHQHIATSNKNKHHTTGTLMMNEIYIDHNHNHMRSIYFQIIIRSIRKVLKDKFPRGPCLPCLHACRPGHSDIRCKCLPPIGISLQHVKSGNCVSGGYIKFSPRAAKALRLEENQGLFFLVCIFTYLESVQNTILHILISGTSRLLLAK